MKDVNGKVAFITGGASGIGLGMAKVFTNAGIRVVIADLRQDHLEQAVNYFTQAGKPVHPICLDVSDRDAMEQAAAEAERVHGKIHILCNNAGVIISRPIDEATYEDWDWVIDVNLNAVFNGVHTFVPKIQSHGEGGHIVNTASMAAFVAGPTAGIYTATKFAVRGLSESLRLSLAQHNIGVSVLCPGLVKSQIYKSEQIRPQHLFGDAYDVDTEFMERLEQVHEMGMDPVEIGEKVLRGIKQNDLFILSHPDHKEEVRELCDEIIAAFPDEEPEPQRMAFERMRQQTVIDIKNKIKANS